MEEGSPGLNSAERIWERLRVEEGLRRRNAAEAERRRRIEESERCALSIDDRICARTPDRCPCHGSGRCGKRTCRSTSSRRSAVGAPSASRPARRSEIPPCGPRHACLAFRRDCACSTPRACPYAQCMRIGSDFPDDILSETAPLAPRDETPIGADSPTLGIIRPLRARDFGSERCETPDQRSACRLGLSCPCVFSGLCDEAGCGRGGED